MSDMEPEHMTVSGNNFFVHVAGKTNDAHLEFVKKFKSIGKKQVDSPGESDFLLVFCPVVSRVGTDINVALRSIPGHKAAILVVMHHTFDPKCIVAESRRQVDNPNVRLTVDCLFYKGRLLTCNRNNNMWLEVEKLFGFYRPEVSILKEFLRNYVFTKGGFVVAVGFVILLWYQSVPAWNLWSWVEQWLGGGGEAGGAGGGGVGGSGHGDGIDKVKV